MAKKKDEVLDKGNKKLKVNRFDRIMAIQRDPEFQNEYKKYLSLNGEDQKNMYEKLCSKYGENIHLIYTSINWRVEDYDYYREIIGRGIFPNDKPGESKNAGRYMSLLVDLHVSPKQLVQEFSQILKGTKKLYKVHPEKNNRRTEYDHWEIYDKVKSGLKKSQIADEKVEEEKNKPKRTHLSKGAIFKRVSRAYNRAEEIIRSTSCHNKSKK